VWEWVVVVPLWVSLELEKVVEEKLACVKAFCFLAKWNNRIKCDHG
jgi:hypothetical protein